MVKKIMVIEDESDLMAVVITRLEGANYHVIFEVDPVKGLVKIKNELPDLVLIDIMMSKLDGFEACARIKDGKGTKDIPVVLVTGSIVPDLEERVHECRADGLLKKPFEVGELMSTVERFVK